MSYYTVSCSITMTTPLLRKYKFIVNNNNNIAFVITENLVDVVYT